MFEAISKQMEKAKVIETYRHLRGLFDKFRRACEKVLVPENYFGARFEALDDTVFFLYIFDIPIRVKFSVVLCKDDQIFYGKLTLSGYARRSEEIDYLTLYFDFQGNIKEDINQKMNFRSLEKPEDIEYVLWAIVIKLIELPFFETE